MLRLSVIVPTYNEADNVEPLVRALSAALKNVNYEIVIVDDNSPDRTWQRAAKIAESNPCVRVIRRTAAPGLAASVIEGFTQARGDILACMDGDLQHDPETLLPMLERIEAGYALVVASRYVSSGSTGAWSPVRRLESLIATKLAQWLLKITLSDPMSGFFMMRRSDFLKTRERLHAQGFKVLLEIVAALEARSAAEVPYRFRERITGRSKLSGKVVLAFLAQLLRLSAQVPFPRIVKFGIVGAVGMAVNLASMAAIIAILGWTDWRASSLATLIATINNYLLNNAWTFRDRLRNGHRLLRGYMLFCASSLAGLTVTTLAYTGVVAAFASQPVQVSLPKLLLAQAIAILCGFAVNYTLSRRVTWRMPQQSTIGPT